MDTPDTTAGDRQDRHFDALLRAATDYAIIGVDAAGTVTVFNSGAERMLGYDAAEVVGRLTPVAFHDAAEIEARAVELGIEPGFDVFVQAARAGGSETREWTYVRQDGSMLPVSLTVTAIHGDGGGPTGFLGIARDLTADREARAELVRAAQRFATGFEANPVPTMITRLADGLILMANSASLSVFGWPAEEFIGRTVGDIALWARPEQRQGLVDQLRAEGRVREYAVDIRRRDGTIRQALGTIELLELDGERCMISIFQDVTEHRRLQEALRESEARLTAFLDHAPAIVSLKDRDGRIVLVNRRMTEDLGIQPGDMIGASTRDHFPEAAEAAEDADQRVLDGAQLVTMRQAVPGRDGRVRDYHVLKFPLRSSDGTVEGVGTIATEVTERQQTERWAGELFDSFASPVGLYEAVRDATGEVVDFRRQYANPRLAELIGRPIAEVIGASMRRTGLEAALDVVFMTFKRVLETGQTERLPDLEIVDPRSGQPVVLAITVSRVGDRIAQVSRDVTLERDAEREIQAAREAAESANLAKSAFLSRMSHELRTPLNAILGFGQLLELEDLTDSQHESVAHIAKAGRHLLGLIDEVLDISRIETGDLPLSLEPVALDRLSREVLDMVAPAAAARSIDLGSPLGPDSGAVLADRIRLKQSLLNLVSNALKYNRDGGRVWLTSEAVRQDRIRILVNDTGIGIAPESLDRLFRPFERLGAEGSGIEGTGLGLALTKRLVEAMRGTIGADSTVGAGSTFWIELESTAAGASVADGPVPARVPEPRTVSGTLLYIEDNLSNVQLVERVVARRPGLVMLSAMQGSLGLELARLHRPDIILLDLNLPDTPGDEVLRRLRAEPAMTDIPIVIISADATAGQADRLKAMGANDYLPKPFEIRALLEWIDRATSGTPHATARNDHETAEAAAVADASGQPQENRPTEAGTPLLDETWLDGLRSLDDGDALRSIVGVFIEDARGWLDRLADRSAATDVRAVQAVAHELRGSASTVGATRLSALAATIEEQARRGGLAEPTRLDELVTVLDETLAALRDRIDGTR